MINTVTRSGTNRFSGAILSEFQRRSWGGAARPILADSLTASSSRLIPVAVPGPQAVGHDLPLTLDQFFAGGWNCEALLAADPSSVDPKFRQADQFQAPRELRFSVKFRF